MSNVYAISAHKKCADQVVFCIYVNIIIKYIVDNLKQDDLIGSKDLEVFSLLQCMGTNKYKC